MDENEIVEQLKQAIQEYYDATLKSNECADLTLNGESEEAGRRMAVLTDKEEVLSNLALVETEEERIKKAIRRFLVTQARASSNPKSYMSGGLNLADRIEVLQQFKDMYDARADMFKMIGIDYHKED